MSLIHYYEDIHPNDGTIGAQGRSSMAITEADGLGKTFLPVHSVVMSYVRIFEWRFGCGFETSLTEVIN